MQNERINSLWCNYKDLVLESCSFEYKLAEVNKLLHNGHLSKTRSKKLPKKRIILDEGQHFKATLFF